MSDLLRRPLTEITALLASRELSPSRTDGGDARPHRRGERQAQRLRRDARARADPRRCTRRRGAHPARRGATARGRSARREGSRRRRGTRHQPRLARLQGQPGRARLAPGRAAARGRRDRRRQDQRARVRRDRDHQEPPLPRVAQSVEPRAHARRIERWFLGRDRRFDDPARDRERRRWFRAHSRHLHRLLRLEAQLRPHPARAREVLGDGRHRGPRSADAHRRGRGAAHGCRGRRAPARSELAAASRPLVSRGVEAPSRRFAHRLRRRPRLRRRAVGRRGRGRRRGARLRAARPRGGSGARRSARTGS